MPPKPKLEDNKQAPVEAFSVQLVKKISKKALYQFLIDRKYSGWFDYAMREPGCLPALFQAFTFALKDLTDKRLTLDLIKGIHEQAMTDVERGGCKPGEFRTHPTGYQIKNVFGIKQQFEDFCQQVSNDFSKYGACISIVDKNFLAEETIKSQEDFDQKFDELSYSTASLDELWAAMQEGRLYYRAPASKYIEKLLQKVCDDYNADIQKEKDPINKLKIMIHARKRIIQIHGFSNGNGRMSSLLLQRLLIQNEFPPMISHDRNSIGNLSVDCLVHEIITSIELTLIIFRQAEDYETKQVFSEAELEAKQLGLSAPSELRKQAKTEVAVIENYYKAEQEFYKFVQSPEFTLLESQKRETDVSSLSEYIGDLNKTMQNFRNPPHYCLDPSCDVCNRPFKLSDTLSQVEVEDQKTDKTLPAVNSGISNQGLTASCLEVPSISAVPTSSKSALTSDEKLKTTGSAATDFFVVGAVQGLGLTGNLPVTDATEISPTAPQTDQTKRLSLE